MYTHTQPNLCTYIHTYMHTHVAPIHAHVQSHMRVRTHPQTHATHTHTYTHTHAHTQARTHTHVHTHMYTHTCTHTHTHRHTHTHTHIYTHTIYTQELAAPSRLSLLWEYIGGGLAGNFLGFGWFQFWAGFQEMQMAAEHVMLGCSSILRVSVWTACSAKNKPHTLKHGYPPHSNCSSLTMYRA